MVALEPMKATGACFIEPMLCLAVEKVPAGPSWQYEIKLDGYRAIGVRTKTGVELWSRNKRDFSRRFPKVARALEALPVETVLDGESSPRRIHRQVVSSLHRDASQGSYSFSVSGTDS
jgi:ATP-dependent DNA ligase